MENHVTSPGTTSEEVDRWWHSIGLPNGRTAGHKTADLLADGLASLELPGLSGKSVLDIGALTHWTWLVFRDVGITNGLTVNSRVRLSPWLVTS